jgi:hypothetical protein
VPYIDYDDDERVLFLSLHTTEHFFHPARTPRIYLFGPKTRAPPNPHHFSPLSQITVGIVRAVSFSSRISSSPEEQSALIEIAAKFAFVCSRGSWKIVQHRGKTSFTPWGQNQSSALRFFVRKYTPPRAALSSVCVESVLVIAHLCMREACLPAWANAHKCYFCLHGPFIAFDLRGAVFVEWICDERDWVLPLWQDALLCVMIFQFSRQISSMEFLRVFSIIQRVNIYCYTEASLMLIPLIQRGNNLILMHYGLNFFTITCFCNESF